MLGNTIRMEWCVAIAAATGLVCSSQALAKKPDKPPGGDDTPPYALVDLLGIPGGASLQSDAVSLSEPDADGRVLVVGESYLRLQGEPEGEYRPTCWPVNAEGSFPIDQIDLGMPPGAIAARASDVNDLGWITISVITSDGHEGLVDVPGFPLRKLPSSGLRAYPHAVNNVGEVVGWTEFEETGNNGALWTLDAEGVPGNPASLGDFFPYDLNDLGVMAGDLGDQAAIAWFDAAGDLQVQPLGVLPGYDFGRANAISQNGTWVAGYVRAVEGPWEAFLWSAATGMIGLGRFGGVTSIAFGVNNSGQVVGWTDTGGGKHSQTAFLWQDGQMLDLNSLADSGDKIHLQLAKDINDAGHIVGLMHISRPVSESHGFLLIPNSQ